MTKRTSFYERYFSLLNKWNTSFFFFTTLHQGTFAIISVNRDFYNILCTANTQQISRQGAIITIRLYLATHFDRDRPSSGQLRTILRYNENCTHWNPISFTLKRDKIWEFLLVIKAVELYTKMVTLNLHVLYSGLTMVHTLTVLYIRVAHDWPDQSSWNKYEHVAKVTTNTPIYINEVLRYQFVHRKISSLTFETDHVCQQKSGIRVSLSP